MGNEEAAPDEYLPIALQGKMWQPLEISGLLLGVAQKQVLCHCEDHSYMACVCTQQRTLCDRHSFKQQHN